MVPFTPSKNYFHRGGWRTPLWRGGRPVVTTPGRYFPRRRGSLGGGWLAPSFYRWRPRRSGLGLWATLFATNALFWPTYDIWLRSQPNYYLLPPESALSEIELRRKYADYLAYAQAQREFVTDETIYFTFLLPDGTSQQVGVQPGTPFEVVRRGLLGDDRYQGPGFLEHRCAGDPTWTGAWSLQELACPGSEVRVQFPLST